MTPKKRSGQRTYTPGNGHPSPQFPVVGIGASAGGLEAFEGFFKTMLSDAGIAFVLVAHLDPTHVSILPELIQKKTGMKVFQVTDNMAVAPDQVFIIPPNRQMVIFNNKLQLLEIDKPRGANLPIDTFFFSLAQDKGHMAIGIILSGTGSDGTRGIKAIKGEGGMVMAQDINSAKYDGMPGSAIATGEVDFILPPEDMPDQLVNYVRHQTGKKIGPIGGDNEKVNSDLLKIYALLRASTGHDFSQYKKNTICRRIERRMNVHQIDGISQYIRYLQESDSEVSILFHEMLIGVTSFFRDAEAYEALQNNYLPELLKSKPDDYHLRIWVPGCSSGEEVYSLAIVVMECLEALGRFFTVQIFGTDLDKVAIDVARAGSYPESISADVSKERLLKFFIKTDGHYQVKKSIREMVVFAPQNIINDPPFTKLDLLSCRNLLIYFGVELQKKLLTIFNFSLKPDGILFLGTSENINQVGEHFTLLDKKWKIFKHERYSNTGQYYNELPRPLFPVGPSRKESQYHLSPLKDANTLKLLKVLLRQSELPACVVIDDKASIIYIHGRTGRFLEPAEGEATNNIFEMARPGLKTGLTNAFQKMTKERREVKVKNLKISNDGRSLSANLIVKPIPDLQTGRRGLMLVIFEESPSGKKHTKASSTSRPAKSEELENLENELQFTRENLQATIEELEISNEELKSTNEELQSTNEELQSTNEELETSKEELQSLHEESVTVNTELQNRIDDLVAANDDIKNLLDTTEVAIIFLDINLNIRRFTPKVNDFIPLKPTDIGRPIGHFATSLKNLQLKESAAKVLKDLGMYETVVEDEGGLQYRMRARPYRTINNVIEGVVISFEDTTEYLKVTEALSESEELLRVFVEKMPSAACILTEGNISCINSAGRDLLGATSPNELLGTSILAQVDKTSRRLLGDLLDTIPSSREPVSGMNITWQRPDKTTVDTELSAFPVVHKGNDSVLLYAMTKP